MRTLAALLLAATLSGCTGGGPVETSSPPAAPGPGPASSSSPSATTAAAPEAGLEELPEGPPPRIAYVDADGVMVHPDGGRERLVGQRRIGVTAFTRFRDGYLVADARTFEGTVGLAYVAGRQRTDLGPCASGGAELSGDGRQVAWMTQACPESESVAPTLVHVAPVAGEGEGEEQREISRIGIVGVAGFVGDEVVVSGYHEGVELVGPGGATRPLPRLRGASDTSDTRGLVAGLLRPGTQFGAVVDATTGRAVWKRRHTEPTLFSPDGTLVAGYVGRRPALLNATTGAVVALVLLAPRTSLYGLVWEDGLHLLGTASTPDRQAMVRVDLTGHLTRVGPVEPDGPYGAVFENRS